MCIRDRVDADHVEDDEQDEERQQTSAEDEEVLSLQALELYRTADTLVYRCLLYTSSFSLPFLSLNLTVNSPFFLYFLKITGTRERYLWAKVLYILYSSMYLNDCSS